MTAIPQAEIAPPREGLPPCVQATVFDGRMAITGDSAKCGGRHARGTRFAVDYGPFCEMGEMLSHPGQQVPLTDFSVTSSAFYTDDEAEARAAYERACEWVRTGVLPE